MKVDKAAREREKVILKQLEEKEPLPDKEKDQMAWVRKWQKNIIALCQHRLCIAPDRGIKAKEMRYNRLYDFWGTMESKK